MYNTSYFHASFDFRSTQTPRLIVFYSLKLKVLHQSLGSYISVSVYTSLSTSLDFSSLGVNHCSLFWLMFIELKQKREAHQRIKAEERGAAKYEDSTGDQYVYFHGS